MSRTINAVRCSLRALVLAAAVHAGTAAATTVIAKDLQTLCDEADRIFVGTVVAVRSQWAGRRGGSIETTVTVTVENALLGDDAREVRLRFAGGQVDGIGEKVAGLPQFKAGDRVLLFVRDGHWVSPIVGFHQGYFRVVDGGRAGPVVLNALGRPVVGIETGAVRSGAGAAADALSLGAFLDEVRRRIAHRPGEF